MSVKVTNSKTAPTQKIAVDGGTSGMHFPKDNAVEITGETNDVFDAVMRQSARVRIQTPEFIAALFTPDVMQTWAEIDVDGVPAFRGRILPQTYSQPFSETLDDLDINLVDNLSALEYLPWRIGMNGGASITEPMTFSNIITGILSKAGGGKMGIDLPGAQIYRTPSGASLLEAKIDTSIFEDEDDLNNDTSLLEVLESVLKFLGLHVVQEGNKFRIFRREVQTGTDVKTFTGSNAFGTDTQIEVGESFNKISVEVNLDDREELFESPMDTDNLESDFARVKFCTEASLLTKSANATSLRGMGELLNGETYPTVTGDDLWEREWYIRALRAKGWTFHGRESSLWRGLEYTRSDYYKSGDTQQANFDRLGKGWIAAQRDPGAGLYRIGTARTDYSTDEFNPPSSLNEEDTMVISVGGDGKFETMNTSGGTSVYDNDFKTDTRYSMPRAVYKGSANVASLSPEDEEVTRYVVISGKLALTPAPDFGSTIFTWGNAKQYYNSFSNKALGADALRTRMNILAQGDEERQRYYLCKPWSGEDNYITSLMFDENESRQTLKLYGRVLTYKNPGWPFNTYTSCDAYRKIGLLVCMLVVGDKCLVEKSVTNTSSDLVWQPYKTLAQCGGNLDTYIKQSFTIGIDPKNGETLVGSWFDIANNVDYTMNISEEGMAIPVRKGDNVSGQVRFAILGPTDLLANASAVSNGCTNLGLSYYGLLSTGSTSPETIDFSKYGRVMRLVQSIWLRDFEIKIVSDNAGKDPIGEGKLVYTSAVNENFRNEREAEEFLFGSSLTAQEREQLKLRDMVRSTTVISPDGGGLLQVVDPITGQIAKAEQFYVDRYWHECNRVAVELTQSVRTEKLKPSMFTRYTHPALPGREFYPLSISRNLSEGSATLRLREIRN